MWRALVLTATQWLTDLHRAFIRPHSPVLPRRLIAPPPAVELQPLKDVRLTDGVGRTLFEEFAAHRGDPRGEEETGWLLLGLREPQQAVILATLPAGAQREASVSHVRFNATAQALASRIVRQADRRLTILGLVHTHPGSLRHPSDGDFQGDRQWVRNLRGGEGVFAIGTMEDHKRQKGQVFMEQPRPHVQKLEDLCLSWYALGGGDSAYRALPVTVTIGPDLARPLHAVWGALEVHAERLERLYRQQAGVTFTVLDDSHGPRLAADVPLAEGGTALRVVLTEKEVHYYTLKDGQMRAVGCLENRVDRGVYLLLAELAGQE